MNSGRGRNVGASVRARLGNLARTQGVAFDYVLNRYAVERLLHRLSNSARRDDFVLKGATFRGQRYQRWSTRFRHSCFRSSARATRDRTCRLGPREVRGRSADQHVVFPLDDIYRDALGVIVP